MSQTTIDKIVEHAQKIKAGEHDKVHPGQPQRLSEAASEFDAIWQGDLGLVVLEASRLQAGKIRVPDLEEVWERHPATPAGQPFQLVPGNTEGARHVIQQTAGCDIYTHDDWRTGEAYEGLFGPVLLAREETVVGHPTHGAVTIPKGMLVLCVYQREYDAEQARERRNAD